MQKPEIWLISIFYAWWNQCIRLAEVMLVRNLSILTHGSLFYLLHFEHLTCSAFIWAAHLELNPRFALARFHSFHSSATSIHLSKEVRRKFHCTKSIRIQSAEMSNWFECISIVDFLGGYQVILTFPTKISTNHTFSWRISYHPIDQLS